MRRLAQEQAHSSTPIGFSLSRIGHGKNVPNTYTDAVPELGALS